ncbi:nuclear transport factor 2 family protein [Ancylobacter oerskovii]|uniref:Nuclear transport factor 2 family protein n=1 Tax=Ancylobacter oerskovii TaxID=459519 RepID=A0ABW4Z592_9HYPH|nr:nuclear transport factor 2 family protein [Ancylobacter oerskovii]MBS7542484.1 nuclear transport factor 2 family protein [Ancylobacter oerskovii]
MTADLERRLRALEDEAEIHRLAARFSDAVNERDLAAFGRLWAEAGAVWSIGPPLTSRAEGREAIVGLLESLYKLERYFMQMTHSGVVTLDGDRATARYVVREHGRGDGTYYENLAVYNDELVREADGWRFATRSYVYRFLSQKPVDEEAFEVTGDHPDQISQ